ncbi:hypothetical protein M2352_003898 [Azospirillum fermentarium]|uniref:hypothetical protein n=1 Tax=Azospirillum fermentarium TaxID=1233114 RepID=UPI002227FB78|nr:hypothetical protein [Azospirillum fermentarium]MCW2248264.1 hypothetical protein [Azospirillum fermentarium]
MADGDALKRKPFVNTGRYAGDAPRTVDRPEPGFFKIRLVRSGPWVPARIWNGPPHDPLTGDELDRSWRLQVQVFDFAPAAEFSRICRVWTHGVRIAERDYRYMRDRIAWLRANRPADPLVNPFRPVILDRLQPRNMES